MFIGDYKVVFPPKKIRKIPTSGIAFRKEGARDMNHATNDFALEQDSHRNETNSESQPKVEVSGISKTYVVASLVSLGAMMLAILRNNLTMAVVEMMANKTIVVGNQTIIQEPEFKWDSKTRGFLLSAIFYGHLATPLGGFLADKYGGMRIYGCGILISSILTITTPINLRLNFYWYCFCRLLEGVSEGMSLPAVESISARWAKSGGKSKFVSFGCMGNYLGATISFPLCGYLAFTFGWRGIFYGTGLMALYWSLIWLLVMPNDSPKNHESRSRFRQSANKKIAYPWKQILTSKNIWALCIAKISFGFGHSIVTLCVPIFLRAMTSHTITEISWLSTIPNAVTIFAMPTLGCLADYLINKNILSTTQVHKLYFSGCLTIAAGILISLGFVSKLSIFMVCVVVFKILLNSATIVVYVMPICMAPAYASLIFAMTSFWYMLSHIISPLYMGFLVTNYSVDQWRVYFISTAIVMIIGSVVFAIYSSSELQPWAIQENEKTDETENLNENNQR